ncbi:PepSY domain-containing protein [Parablautia muri]|uniref:PepSY domain-containing protein n=1 Tax=Parablautia muri TaxID=2320879 RepID=A0A9X5GQ57_9FIRM|nr:PepSY domain-containing protein [Parablautia muri]NBJ91673.1 hypothetical protein [Parablautia muri]
MKKIFSSPKKAIIFVVCVVAVLGAISITAVKSTLISKEDAKEAALRDAGLSETEASALRTRLEFEDGRFQYEVDFYSNGVAYEYQIQAKDGDIIARDMEGGANNDVYGQELQQGTSKQSAADEERSVPPQETTEQRSLEDGDASAQSQRAVGASPSAEGNTGAQSQGKSLEEAKAAALTDAGLAEANVTFKKTELDHERGMQVYDIEFYTADAEYDYKINASDGTVVEKSVEAFLRQTHAADGSANADDNYIGVDRAKEIALNHANLKESDVRFAKAKLENDDGSVEYEIEFYFERAEYGYTIDAVSGNIIEYDVDYD